MSGRSTPLLPGEPQPSFSTVISSAPLFVEVKPDASYSATCSGDPAVCKGFQTTVSSGDLRLLLVNTPQTSTPTSILVTLPAAQLGAGIKTLAPKLSSLSCWQATNGAGNIQVDAGFTPSTFIATSRGSGSIGISSLSTGNVSAYKDGSGEIVFVGLKATGQVTINSGSGNVGVAGSFPCASITGSGSGVITVAPSDASIPVTGSVMDFSGDVYTTASNCGVKVSGSGKCETGGPQPSLPVSGPGGVTSCAPLFVEVKPDASYSAICSGDAAVCKGFQTSVSSGNLHLELSNTPQTSTPTSIVVTLPAAQLNKVATDGAGTIQVDAGFTPSTFTASSGGSGDIGISSLSTGSVTATTDGSGDVVFVGLKAAGPVTITSSGSGNIGVAGSFPSASVTGSGSGEITVAPSDASVPVTGSVSGSGDVHTTASNCGVKMSGSGDCETGGPQPSLPVGGPSGVSQCQGSSCTCGGGGGSSGSSTPGSGSNGGTNICNGASGSNIVQNADGRNAGPGNSNGQPGVNLCGQS
eukprot:jgi/Astpho2/8835/Aster-05471